LIRIARANPMLDNLPYNLGAAYKMYCPNGPLVVDKEDPWRLRWYELAGKSVPEIRSTAPEALRYLELDVQSQGAVFDAQEGQYGTQGWLLDQFNQTRASFSLYLAQCWGFTTDLDAARALEESTRRALDEAARVCEAHGLVVDGKRKIAAAAARQEAAYARQGLPVPRGAVTEKAKAKAHREAVASLEERGMDFVAAEEAAKAEVEALLGNAVLDEEACIASGDPVMVAYSQVSQSSLLLGKVRRLGRGLIQASYNTIVNSGRTSCSQGKDPKKGQGWKSWGSQLQNPPREVLDPCRACGGSGLAPGSSSDDCPACKGKGGKPIPGMRECFVSRPGYVLVSVDYDAFELRTWAQCCRWMVGYSALGDILNDPKRDPHVEMGASIHRMPAAAAYALKATDKKLFKALRQVAKAANFGLPGGMGAERFVSSAWDSYQVRLGDTPESALDEAKRIIAAWKAVYPEAQPYLDLIGQLVGPRGSRTRIVQHYSARVRGGVGFCDAANTFFQGLAADAAKRAMWLVCREMYARRSSPLYGSRIVAFIHDELLVEIPIEKLQEAAARLQELWTGGAQEVIPDVLITAAPAASFRWSKSAGDPVYDAAGRLIPFELSDGYQGLAPPPGQIDAWLRAVA
jgi:DNA polymerase-1